MNCCMFLDTKSDEVYNIYIYICYLFENLMIDYLAVPYYKLILTDCLKLTKQHLGKKKLE